MSKVSSWPLSEYLSVLGFCAVVLVTLFFVLLLIGEVAEKVREWRRCTRSLEAAMAVDTERERIRGLVEGRLFEYEGTDTGKVLERLLEAIDDGDAW